MQDLQDLDLAGNSGEAAEGQELVHKLNHPFSVLNKNCKPYSIKET